MFTQWVGAVCIGVVTTQMFGGVERSADHSSTGTTTDRMTTKEDEGETREPGKNPFPVSRIQKILKADTVRYLAEGNRRWWLTRWTATPNGLERGRVSHFCRHREVH